MNSRSNQAKNQDFQKASNVKWTPTYISLFKSGFWNWSAKNAIFMVKVVVRGYLFNARIL